MKRILLATAAFALSAALAHAGDVFEGYYGNTVNITYPDGKTAKAYVNPDKTYENHRSDGLTLKGTYEAKPDGTVCFTQKEPPPPPEMKQPFCTKVDPHKPGDSWSSKDDKGNETKLTMTAGR